MAALTIGSALNPINSSIMAIALVAIGAAFGVGASSTAWLVSSAYIASAVGQPTMGRLADRFGPRDVYLAGLGLVAAGALLGTVAESFWLLIVARVILGFGTSAAYPAAMAIIRRKSARDGRPTPGFVLGALSIASQVSMGVGPLIGGLIMGPSGWRGIFLVNFPLVAIAALFAQKWLPRDPARAGGDWRRGLDLPGAALFVLALTLGMLSLLAGYGWPLGLAALATACAFVVWEMKAAAPFIDLRVLVGQPQLCATYVRNCGGFLVLYAFTYGWTQWLSVSGYSPAQVGALLTPTFLVGALTSAAASRRRTVFLPLVAGSLSLVLLSGAMIAITYAPRPEGFLLLSALAGVATGGLAVGNQAALYIQAPQETIGVAAGLLRTTMNLGAVLSASVIGVVYGDAASDSGLRRLGTILLGLSVALTLGAVLDRNLRRRPAGSR